MPNISYAQSKNLYKNKYCIHKTIVSENLYLPNFKKKITHKFIFASINSYASKEPYGADIKKCTIPIINVPASEIMRYCPKPDEQKAYFYIEAFDDNEKLPSYCGFLYLNDYFDMWEYKQNTKENYGAFLQCYGDEFNGLIYEGKIHHSTCGDFFQFLHDFGGSLAESLDTNEAGPEIINEYETNLKELKEPALKYFMQDIINSFVERLTEDKVAMRCQHCDIVIDYVEGKKFCSIKAEGRDCGKSARNKRYYSTTGQKRLPKYRKATKELRAFYKEKGIKK